ncbi:MAG: hypothetical protein Q9160_004598 [Pyrenula sp. 1 TL-2023]
MHDLRRQALESGKTVSKKARSKQSSQANSRPNSRPASKTNSRVNSRNASDDEFEGNLSDDTSFSINSIDELLSTDDVNEEPTEAIREKLLDCIGELLERKRSSTKSREDCLASYAHILRTHLLADQLRGRTDDVISAITKSIKTESSELETILALKALEMTIITFEDEDVYDNVAPLLRRAISDSQSLQIKKAAIYCLGNCAFFAGAGQEEIAEQMSFLLEIVSSDGAFIDAHDHPDTVTAAIQVYALLATAVDDMENDSEDAIEAFADQLDSTDPDVQVAAGEAIALLYEKSYTSADSDNSSDEDLDDDDDDADDAGAGSDSDPSKRPNQRYLPFHATAQLITTLSSLASLSTKKLDKKTKRHIHQTFTSVLATVRDPRLGIYYNNASRMTVRIHNNAQMKIDRWWKLMRLNALRRLLGAGFVAHYYEGNKQVLSVLPVLMRDEHNAVKTEKVNWAKATTTRGVGWSMGDFS